MGLEAELPPQQENARFKDLAFFMLWRERLCLKQRLKQCFQRPFSQQVGSDYLSNRRISFRLSMELGSASSEGRK